jgi:hypothetical protein
MPAFRILAVIAFLAFLAGCASLSEDQCRGGDWAGIGFSDGAAGRGLARLEAHRRACAEVGIVPDVAAWTAGRERGLRAYCTPEVAYREGRRGASIAEGCTAAERSRMIQAHDRGRQFWRIEQEIRDLRTDMREIEREIASLPPDAPGRGSLFAQRAMVRNLIAMAELRQRRYAYWP